MIPIVMAAIAEPLDVGVRGEPRAPAATSPGSAPSHGIGRKRVELLKEARPSIARVGFCKIWETRHRRRNGKPSKRLPKHLALGRAL